MDIQVGDRITYRLKIGEYKGVIQRKIISLLCERDVYSKMLENDEIEIFTIERPKYEVVEENKELLTEDEKQFLKDICKYYNIDSIEFYDNHISFIKNDIPQLSPIYPENIKFINVEKWIRYTLKELGLEE